MVANVKFMRRELKDKLPAYEKIRDCIEGETAIKMKGQKYLPNPGDDADREERGARNLGKRYEAYRTRAIFYAVAQYSLAGMVGTVFSRNPVAKVPSELNPIVEDATGVGVSVDQLAKQAVGETVSLGRCGLFVDYPQTEGVVTQADLASGRIRPWLTLYLAEKIINWRVAKIGGISRLTLVVLEEPVVLRDDGFEQQMGVQYRVLRLVPYTNANGTTLHRYRQEIWKENGTAAATIIEVTGPDGEPFDSLPFMFMGAKDNDPSVDAPPLYPLCTLNIGHYRNSADYEESVFIVGQPTPYITGVTRDWVTNIWRDKQVRLGSRSAIVLPAGGTAGLIQAEANTMAKDAMLMKEDQMVATGAKLVQKNEVANTATEANIDESASQSTLVTCAVNVAYGFEWALAWCAAFMGVSEAGVKYSLNTEFDLVRMTPQEQQQMVANWQAEAISYTELRSNLRRAGIVMQSDEIAQAENKANPAPVKTPAVNNPPSPKLTLDNPAAV